MPVKPTAKLALCASRRMSHASARLMPAPAATPFTPATTGFSRAAMARTTGWYERSRMPPMSPSTFVEPRSAPAQKPRPAPVISTARTPGSAAGPLRTSASSASSSKESALSTSGRSRVTRSAPPRSARVRFRYAIVTPTRRRPRRGVSPGGSLAAPARWVEASLPTRRAARGQRQDDVVVVGHVGVVERGAVAAHLAAGAAAVDDHPPLLARALHPDRLEHAAAVGGAVAGVDVDVQRVQAVRAVVAVAAGRQRRHRGAAHDAVERLVGPAADEALHHARIALGATAGGRQHDRRAWLRWRRARPLPDPGRRMELLVARGVTRLVGGSELFAGVDLRLAAGDRLGLVGPNG